MQRPWQTLLSSVSGYERLDYDLTVTGKVARDSGLPSLWSRLRNDPATPTQVEVAPAGDLAYTLRTLKTELAGTALLACDPGFRVNGATSEAENLLSFVSGGVLLERSLTDITGLKLLPSERARLETEVSVPINRREMIKLRLELEPHVDFTGRASGWLARLAFEPYHAPSLVSWQTLIQQFPGVILRFNEQGKILFANRQVGEITAEKLKGRSLFDLVPEDYQYTLRQFRHSMVGERRTVSGEVPIVDAQTAERIWFRFTATPLMSGEEVEMLVYATDISLEKQISEELQASRQHIRSLTSLLDRTQEEERKRISRELHDQLGGLLTAVRLELGALERGYALNEAAVERLDVVDTMLQDTLSTVRRLSTQLRPPILDDLGLRAALRALVEETAQRCGFEAQVGVETSLPGDSELHLQVYRICQEALTNIARHAQACRVKLRLTRPYRNRLELVIEDDGLGFDLEEATRKGSLGHRGIAERVNLLGGKLRLKSQPNRGCRLKITIPLREPL